MAYSDGMVGLLVLWTIPERGDVDLARMRRYIREESLARFRQVPGLRLKTWISNPETRRWGAFYLFETEDHARAVIEGLETGRASQLIGTPPRWELFDVEAVIEGAHRGSPLTEVGKVFDDSVS